MAISRTNRKIYYLKYILTVFLIDTDPFPNPRAKYWPSFVQEHELIRALILNFCTDFCSCDHSAKSEMAHEANKLDVGLYAKHWTASLWLKNGIIYIIFPVWNCRQLSIKTYEYFKIPSYFEFHMITVLSALPDANFFPSLVQHTQ